MTPYLMNTWYVAAWAEEVPTGGTLARTLLDRKLTFWRRSDGIAVAMENRCPHRFAELSRGKVSGDQIICGYHGLAFDASGACVHHPFGEKIPTTCRVPVVPLEERNGLLWFWPGDPSKADAAKIPDFKILDWQSGYHTTRHYFHCKANYELINDNLMDLTHLEYVHENTLGGRGLLYAAEHTVDVTPEYIDSNYLIRSCPPVPPDPADLAPYDVYLEMRWIAPCYLHLESGRKLAGSQEREAGRSKSFGHILTPETGSTTHYFWACVIPDAIAGPEPHAEMQRRYGNPFENEDEPMLESVQSNLGDRDFWEEHPVLLNIDAAAIQVRRTLARLIQEEAGTVVHRRSRPVGARPEPIIP
jgi:phenylpropionate dioxygenase-like ring-hydroxylating dioxygenase large terminal subunit